MLHVMTSQHAWSRHALLGIDHGGHQARCGGDFRLMWRQSRVTGAKWTGRESTYQSSLGAYEKAMLWESTWQLIQLPLEINCPKFLQTLQEEEEDNRWCLRRREYILYHWVRTSSTILPPSQTLSFLEDFFPLVFFLVAGFIGGTRRTALALEDADTWVHRQAGPHVILTSNF